MTVETIIRNLVEYNDALHRRLWTSIMQLSDEQFVAEIAYSQGSIRNHIVHLAGVDGWLLRVMRQVPDPGSHRLDPTQYPTRQSAYTLWDNVARDLTTYVASLDEASLLCTPHGGRGAIWQVLFHIVNHGTDHRAQVLRALHDLGAVTFEQDFALYQWFPSGKFPGR